MTGSDELKASALEHCRQALELLDRAGDPSAAVKVQPAIDVISEARVPRTIEEAEEMLGEPAARTMMRQMGL